MPVAAILAIAVTGIIVVRAPAMSGGGEAPALRELVAAVGSARRTEARVTGGFAYGPWLGHARTSATSTASLRVLVAADTIRSQTVDGRTPRELQARARAHFALQEPVEALTLLVEGAQRGPFNAGVLSDLGAAYLTRATSEAQPEDVPQAIAFAERALSLEPSLLEALFNRALALEYLPLPTEAVKAWDAYLAKDRTSAWAGEARQRRARLLAASDDQKRQHDRYALTRALEECQPAQVDALVLRSAQFAREIVEQDLLAAWARATSAGRSGDAAQALQRARCASDALARIGSDRLPAATLGSLSLAPPSRQQQLARAFVAYDDARRLYDSDRIAESQPPFIDAERALTARGNPFSLRARFDVALTLFYARRTDEAAAIFDEVIRTGTPRRYLDLVGRAHWVRGLLRPMPAGYDSRLADYRAALRVFEEAREWPSVAAVHMLLGETHQLYGDARSAWHHRQQSLEALPITRDPRRRHVLLLDGARASLQEGLPETAAHFVTALLDSARAWGRDYAIAEAYRVRADANVKLGRMQDAEVDLREAEHALGRVSDRGLAARLDPYLRTTLAELEVARSPERARALATEAMTLQRAARYGHNVPRLWILRARAYLAEGKPADAARELDAGISEVEAQRVSFTDSDARRTYLDECWDLYRTMVDVQTFALNRPDRGLAFAERGRARRLLDQQPHPLGDPLVTAWPLDTVGLVYVVLEDRTLLWILRPGEAEFRSLKVSRLHLASLVRLYDETIAVGDDDRRLDVLGAELYDLLIAPAASRIANSSRLVIVPDDVLVGVPFDALRGAETARLLGDDRIVTVAPSATSYVDLLRRVQTIPSAAPHALTITSSSVPPSLPALPYAAREATALARIYPRHTAIDAGRVPKVDVLKALPSHSVVHVALHALAGSSRLDPYLVLGDVGTDGTTTTISRRDVEALQLDGVRLVVLAGCSTARGIRSRAEGVVSLASSFLVAGVPTVLASLWDVEDRAAHELVVRFHQNLARGADAGRALADAQRAMREGADPGMRLTKSWAGFVLIGAPVSIQPSSLSFAPK